jgi:hypothetical protein
MSILRETTDELRTLTAELLEASQEDGLAVTRVAERLQRVVELLSAEEAHWIGTTEAKRLLGVHSEHTVKAWARLGLLRSRTLPNGRLQVDLDDVFQRRAETEDLTALDGEELSDDELRLLRGPNRASTPGSESNDPANRSIGGTHCCARHQRPDSGLVPSRLATTGLSAAPLGPTGVVRMDHR